MMLRPISSDLSNCPVSGHRVVSLSLFVVHLYSCLNLFHWRKMMSMLVTPPTRLWLVSENNIQSSLVACWSLYPWWSFCSSLKVVAVQQAGRIHLHYGKCRIWSFGGLGSFENASISFLFCCSVELWCFWWSSYWWAQTRNVKRTSQLTQHVVNLLMTPSHTGLHRRCLSGAAHIVTADQ